MANSEKLAEVCAMIVERDEEFCDIENAATCFDENSGEKYWSLSVLSQNLGIENPRRIKHALNQAKIAAHSGEMLLSEHFIDGSIFDEEDDIFLTKYACWLFVMNSDPSVGKVGLAQAYFALQLDKQSLEDEKRLRTRLDVTEENKQLSSAAKQQGVKNFGKFNGMGVQGLYGGLSVAQVNRKKCLTKKESYLDYAGSEELAANLFRITQTRAALARQGFPSETLACNTHKKVGEQVRRVIIEAGNTPPEELPTAELKIDRLATKTKKQISST